MSTSDKTFARLSDPAVAAHFREAIAGGPLTARPLPKLVERLAREPWAEKVAVRAGRSSFALGTLGGAEVRVVFWQHIQTFQVWARAAGEEERVVGQGTVVAQVEKLVAEVAAKLVA